MNSKLSGRILESEETDFCNRVLKLNGAIAALNLSNKHRKTTNSHTSLNLSFYLETLSVVTKVLAHSHKQREFQRSDAVQRYTKDVSHSGAWHRRGESLTFKSTSFEYHERSYLMQRHHLLACVKRTRSSVTVQVP